MSRIAALLVLLSQFLLIWVVLDTNGRTSIWFTFLGHPLVAVGVLVGIVALTRRLSRESQRQRMGEEPRS
jgi:H+/gluconate symporter-like permease